MFSTCVSGRAVGRVSRLAVVFGFVGVLCAAACGADLPQVRGLSPRQQANDDLSAGRWKDAVKTCSAALRRDPQDCAARYCEFLGQTLLFVDQVNSFVLPRYRKNGGGAIASLIHLWQAQRQLARATRSADDTAAHRCEFDGPNIPLLIGDPSDPVVRGELRGKWTVRDVHTVAAILYSFRYLLANLIGHQRVPPPPPGETLPSLPEYLAKMGQHLLAQDQLLFSPAHKAAPAVAPAVVRGGWLDRAGDNQPGPKDELLIDIFRPGTDQRVFDFSSAEFVRGESLPRGPLTATAAMPAGRCGYQRWHIDTLRKGKDVGGTDGMSFSPDGSKLVFPIKQRGHYQIYITNADGKGAVCLTCGQPGSNDGVRWQPMGDALLFISNRDHPAALGGAGGGSGQELYVMRTDGSRLTRLTHSHGFATNYHANWSPDGHRIVWVSTQERTWDVMVADYVDDAAGPHLAHQRRLTHDTTWWETHGFSADGQSVITTNTRAGFMSADIYAIDIATGRRTRLTDDPSWDEHAHLSPDGRKLAWISGRWRPASLRRLNQGNLSPLFDFFWIVPGVFFEFMNQPAGYVTELTLMDADGGHIQRLTNEGQIIADNEWSADGRRIIFRQQQPGPFGAGRIRVLTFDDCQ